MKLSPTWMKKLWVEQDREEDEKFGLRRLSGILMERSSGQLSICKCRAQGECVEAHVNRDYIDKTG